MTSDDNSNSINNINNSESNNNSSSSSDSNNNEINTKIRELSIHKRGMNRDVQAKLLAFQKKRQPQNNNNSNNEPDDDHRQYQPQQDNVMDAADKPLPPLPSHSPPTPLSISSGNNTPMTPREDVNSNGDSNEDGLNRRTSFRDSRTEKKETPALEQASVFRPFGSRTLSSNGESRRQVVVTSNLSSSSNSPSSPFSPFSNSEDTSPMNADGTDHTTIPRLTIPPSVLNSGVKPTTKSGLTAKKSSLSDRRGMKLKLGSFSGIGNMPSKPSSQTQTQSEPPQQQPSQIQQPKSTDAIGKLKQSVIPQRGAPSGNLGATASGGPINNKHNSILNNQPPKLSGMFYKYAKYVDIKSGSLNFAGKASLHSKGVDFPNGASCRLSRKDLEVLGEIAHGNYGVVTKVLHKPTGIIMAMKEVRLELDDSKFTQILMELQVLHDCKSEYIVDFFGAFFVEGAVYMCMEYMNGSLDKIYGDGIDEPELAYITKRVVAGLKDLKDNHNIIHRDVKPTNILTDDNGNVKLCDFGVSGKLVASLAKTNIGCQSYMAPERIESANPDASTYSVQSDIWSLGLSILETAEGSYPYPPETYDNVFSQLQAIVHGDPPELPHDRFTSQAQDFVKQCLNKNPNERPVYAKLLAHPWLNMYDDADCQKLLSKLVKTRIEEQRNGKVRKKQVPALHKGRSQQQHP